MIVKNRKNNFLKIILLLFGLFGSFQVQGQYEGGDGSSSTPFLIASSEQLIALSETSSDWDKHFKLVSDINMAGQAYSPIGNAAVGFTGSFDGGFFTISNLTITAPADMLNGTGLFGKARGHISRTGMSNISISSPGYSRVGAFVGILESGGSVKECFSLGGAINVGSGGWTGSIVGAMFSGSVNTIQDCYSTTAISGSWGCGGIVGMTRGSHVINRVAFYGSVSGGNAIVSIQNDSADSQKNGIPPTNAFFAVSTGATDSESVSLSSGQLLQNSSYATFDFNELWKIDTNLGYAVLQAEIPETPYFEKIKTERVTSNQNVEWKNFGPGTSGYCEEFWCHPTDANVMFSGPDMHAAFGTWDNGQTWQTLKDYDGVGIDLRRVIDIKFSKTDPDYGMLFDNNQTGSGTSGKLFETTDRGRTWKHLKTMGKAHSKLAVHPTNDNIWFLGAGDFWNVKENHRTLVKPEGVKIGRADYGYVWKTTDKGQTWTKVATSISSNLDVGRIIFNPASPNIMVMATSHGMYRSTDTGDTWIASSSGLPHNLPRDLTSYYNESSGEFVLYAVEQTKYTPNGSSITTTGGVYKSTDAGVTWVSITGNLGINLQTITNYWARDRYHRSVAYWLGVSKSVSKTTYSSYPSWTMPVYNRLVVNPTNKNELYIVHNKKHDKGFGPGDVWKTVDGGATWIACARSGEYWIAEENKSYWQAKNNPIGANIDFSHMQRSLDEGSEGAGARMLAINSVGDVFTGIEQQLLRSNDHGGTWKQIDDDETEVGTNKWIGRGNTNLPGRFLLLETGVSGRKLLCSGEHGLWQTTDLGAWPDKDAVAVQQIEGQVHDHSGGHGAHSISTVAVHPNDPNTIFFIAWRQEHRGWLRKSTDGGATWNNIVQIFDADNGSWESVGTQYSLMIDPVDPDNMYFTSVYKPISEVGGGANVTLTKGAYGVYRSTNGGTTWSVNSADFPVGSSINRIAMHPDTPQTIFAAMNQWGINDAGGLYKSINGTVNFTKMTLPAVIKSVNNVFIDRNTKDMFISTGSRSGTFEGGGVWKSTDDGVTWERIFEAPYVWQTEVSPVNSNIITISVPAQVPNMTGEFLNPGVYLSQDAGVTWNKINKGLAHSDRIVDLKPDPIDESVLWCAGWGSAWYKAIIPAGNLAIEDIEKPKKEMFVYPNPVTNGVIHISGLQGGLENLEYSITDITGRIIKSKTLSEKEIDVSYLTNGIYIVSVSKGNNIKFRKIIKVQ